MKLHQRKKPVAGTIDGIDRLVRNVQAGRFERSLSGLAAASAAIIANGSQGTWLHWPRS